MKTSNAKKPTMEKIKHHLLSLFASLLYVLSAGHPVLADDTEVLFGLAGSNPANVLFIIDTSGSMRRDVDSNNPPATGPSRLSIVQNVFTGLMRNPAYQGLNVALMRFDSGAQGGYFVTPMQELNARSQVDIIAAADNLTADGDTPLSETLYEAALFWAGMAVDYGSRSSPATNVSGVSNSADDYISPITSQCQKNFTILLSDGAATSDGNANVKIADLTGNGCNGNCLDEVAGYLYTADQNTSLPNIPGPQIVETFTIGFAGFTDSENLLEAAALAGGGTVRANGIGNDHYFTASTAAELSAAFTEALDAAATNANFTPPALAANTFSGLSHFNKLYFALFKPTTDPKWDGNIKPYALNDSFQLVGIDNNLAVDENGFFTDDSRSFWSPSSDGGDIVAGGANSRLPAATARKLYTYTGTYSASAPDISLSLFNDTNINLTSELLSPTSTITAAQRSDIINAARSFKIGAPLHSQPALVTYSGTNEANSVQTLFVATNDGFLHALDASPSAEGTLAGGKERFAFIPKELLGNLPTLTNNAGAHPYGLDGDISVWVQDSNSDNQIVAADGDHVYIYVGMRRGGNNYYALDVTDPDTPVLKWVIKGGPVLNGGTPGFEELGQSWSKAALTSIKYDNGTNVVSKKVLIFGGGYDTRQDGNPLNLAPSVPGETDSSGRAIFIVDADTGERLWWAGPTGSGANLELASMTHSIPSEVRLLDSTLDGNTDRLYVGDMRGQIFRIDLQATLATSSGVVLASLSGDTEAENRRFYYPPDVVFTQRRSSAPYISVNIGSGYRAHPLNPVNADGTAATRVDDRFYSLRDPYVLEVIPADFVPITNAATDLLDLTNIPVLADDSVLSALDGWYITLGAGNGEKVLAPSITINGEIFFTTYTPPAAQSTPSCEPPGGTGRTYRISLFDASPIIPNTGIIDPDNPPSAPTVGDRSEALNRPGIPSAPTPMFLKNSAGNIGIVTCNGTQCDPLPDAIQMQETYWQEDP